MIHAVNKTDLKVYISTENNYFSQGIFFLLMELLEDEFDDDISICLVGGPDAADLIIKTLLPGEKAFDWIDCDKFRTQNEYRHILLRKKWLNVYPSNEHYDRNFYCPVVNSVITMKNSVKTIRQKLYMLFFSDFMYGPPDFRKPNCGKCPGAYHLTWHEQLLIGYLIKGLGKFEISYEMGCSVKVLGSYRRAIMRKLNIKRRSEFLLWLGTKSVLDKYSKSIYNHTHESYNDQSIWKEKQSCEVNEEFDDKDRVLQSIKRLVDKSDIEDVWLTTREIANEMGINIYRMRYLLCKMENNGKVISIKTGTGKSNTLRWKLAGRKM